jgi:hypothetical protein
VSVALAESSAAALQRCPAPNARHPSGMGHNSLYDTGICQCALLWLHMIIMCTGCSRELPWLVLLQPQQCGCLQPTRRSLQRCQCAGCLSTVAAQLCAVVHRISMRCGSMHFLRCLSFLPCGLQC